VGVDRLGPESRHSVKYTLRHCRDIATS
jgi:hypothetical protein